MSETVNGRCLCGAVRFHTDRATLTDVAVCHCAMCRRWHGHVGAYADTPRTALVFDRQDDLAWFQSSDFARRGFCRVCGSSLFWEAPKRSTISITAGALDSPTGLSTTLQIFAEHKGDYYELDPAVPVRHEPHKAENAQSNSTAPRSVINPDITADSSATPPARSATASGTTHIS